jgi:hypothetical protein
MVNFASLLLVWVAVYQNIPPADGQPDDNNDPKKPVVVFGTENGYDVGGTDPLCWESRLTANEVDFTTSENNEEDSIETLNQELFDSDDPDVHLLPDCPNGTIVSVTPLDLDAPLLPSDDKGENLLYTEQTYTFRLNIQLNMNNVVSAHNWTMPPNGFVFIHCRLHLCDTTQQGFCNPLEDTRERDATLTRADTDVGEATTTDPCPRQCPATSGNIQKEPP